MRDDAVGTLLEFTDQMGQGDVLLLRPVGKASVRATWFSAEREAQAQEALLASPGARLLRVRFAASAPSDKLSFHKRSRLAMANAMRSIAEELSGHSSLGGFALHAFDSLRKLE